MDSGDIIYYIVIIAIGLLSSFFKKKKDSNKSAPKSQPNLDELLKDILDKRKAEPAPVVEKADHTPKSKSTYIPPEYTSPYPNDIDIEHSRKTAAEIIKEHHQKLDIQDEYDDKQSKKKADIDLRQAVIYDVILNRPEY